MLYILVGIVVVLCGCFYSYLHSIALHKVRIRFNSRKVVSFDEWFGKYYGDTQLPKEKIYEILTLLADSLKIEPTQILPSDRFDEEFSYPKNYQPFLIDEPLHTFVLKIKNIIPKHHFTKNKLKQLHTLDDLIKYLNN